MQGKGKFSKKLLGDKIRTQMVYHRIVFKAYANGITIKPIATQGIGDKCPLQEEMFLSNENIGFLKSFLNNFDSAKEILEGLSKKEENEPFTDELGRSARYG